MTNVKVRQDLKESIVRNVKIRQDLKLDYRNASLGTINLVVRDVNIRHDLE